MLGGGIFTSQNKKLPGTYINFVSAAKATAITSERGVVTMALDLDWGVDGEIFKVTNEEFISNSLKIFGYDYSSEKLKNIRELFLNITTLYAYRLNSGEKATSAYATAKYSGIRGNDITIVIATNVDDTEKFDVTTILETKTIETQTVSNASELVDNDYVTFNKDAELATTTGIKLTGGTNGNVTGENHQKFLDKLENYSFNAIGCDSEDTTIANLYASFAKRMREEVGTKFQAVLFNKAADYEGVVNVINETEESKTGLIYWVTGIIASCSINESNTNKTYDGEYTVKTEYTQSELEDALDNGKFVLHMVGDEIRVLRDINSLVTVDNDKGEDFKNNQTIRVMDQIATDTAVLFNDKYLGKIQNNESGRVSLWGDIVKLFEEYQTMQAIENFDSENDVVVALGNDKRSVTIDSAVEPINSMEKLYMSVVIN